ncbi:hypothetical protein UFOVP111_117 [uncultured Caudovirales phage]|uniref:Uncharacterized protein n=1 Tax=uncultured Caudovirales phage TaxID=2100421 RepID=A0A6J5L3N9_9CAUD|nr:hypothetical protein UFOVP111_117 [uncultured Caudovirales phage]
MCAGCKSRNQAAYHEESNTQAGSFTNNNGAQTTSGSVSEVGLPNAQNKNQDMTAATSDNNKGNSQGKGINNSGWGS